MVDEVAAVPRLRGICQHVFKCPAEEFGLLKPILLTKASLATCDMANRVCQGWHTPGHRLLPIGGERKTRLSQGPGRPWSPVPLPSPTPPVGRDGVLGDSHPDGVWAVCLAWDFSSWTLSLRAGLWGSSWSGPPPPRGKSLGCTHSLHRGTFIIRSVVYSGGSCPLSCWSSESHFVPVK